MLNALGKGSGTSKDAVLDDGITLNNIMNKAVFDKLSPADQKIFLDAAKEGALFFYNN